MARKSGHLCLGRSSATSLAPRAPTSSASPHQPTPITFRPHRKSAGPDGANAARVYGGIPDSSRREHEPADRSEGLQEPGVSRQRQLARLYSRKTSAYTTLTTIATAGSHVPGSGLQNFTDFRHVGDGPTPPSSAIGSQPPGRHSRRSSMTRTIRRSSRSAIARPSMPTRSFSGRQSRVHSSASRPCRKRTSGSTRS